MDTNQDMNVLDEVNKGATMGMDAINYLVPKVKDGKFKEVLDIEYNKYKDIKIVENLINELKPKNFRVSLFPKKVYIKNKNA